MSWDQSYAVQSVNDFLLDLLGINAESLIKAEIQKRMKEENLEILNEEIAEDVGDYFPVYTKRLQLSDRRVFEHRLVELDRGDSWGNDYYAFVQLGEEYTIVTKDHTWDEDGDTEKITTKAAVAKERDGSNDTQK